MDDKWFDMNDFLKYQVDDFDWIPLRTSILEKNTIEDSVINLKEKFIGRTTVMLPTRCKEQSRLFNWQNMGLSRTTCFSLISGEFYPYDNLDIGEITGTLLVLDQSFDNNTPNEWHLHQDLVINLGLKRENDTWICPNIDNIVVAKLNRDNDGIPINLLIDNRLLKKYLKTRDSGLYVASFYEKIRFYDNLPEDMSVGITKSQIKNNIMEFNISLEKVNDSSSIDNKTHTRTVYRACAALWKYDWIDSSNQNLGIDDNNNDLLFFISDFSGNKITSEELRGSCKILYFKPTLILEVLSKQNGKLNWINKYSGVFSFDSNHKVRFIVNSLGLVKIIAKLIYELPFWQQAILASHNTQPKENKSVDQIDSNTNGSDSQTVAPEDSLFTVIEDINNFSIKKYKFNLFKIHHANDDIKRMIHRFRVVDNPSLFSLAKDISRIVIENINKTEILKINTANCNSEKGTLKQLEALLSTIINEESAKKIIGPLYAINDLRNIDAHLPSSKTNTDKYYEIIGIEKEKTHTIQGLQLIESCVNCLKKIFIILQRG